VKKLHLLALCLAMFTAACSGGGASYDKNAAPEAPDFALNTSPSGSFHLAAQRGKVVLLEFMSSSCPACDGANAPMVELHRKYAPKGLVMAAVSIDSDGDMSGYAKHYGILYPIALDTEQKTAMDYRLRGTPSFVIIDKQGRIRRYWAGFDRELVRIMETTIELLLQEPA